MATPAAATMLWTSLEANLPVVVATMVADGPPVADMPPPWRIAVVVALRLCCLRRALSSTLRHTTLST